MNYQEYLLPYAKKIDEFLTKFFQQKIKEAEKVDPIDGNLWQKLQEYIGGGKRVRGGLVKLGYECFKKISCDKILAVSAAIEIIHGSLIIHDDVIDQSIIRHNHLTIHKQYEAYHQKNYQKGNSKQYGESLAIVVGIIGYFAAVELINKARFPSNLITRAINQLTLFIFETGYGEGLDIDFACRQKITDKEVLKIYTYKTSYYTFVGPLKIGGALAGAGESQLKKFEDYGIPIGIAFQLQDDILSIFGDEKEIGKPIGDDIKEGKNTLLFTQAIKRGTPQQRQRLNKLWGKKDITLEEIKEAREIILQTGSFEYSQKMAQKLVKKGKKAIPKITKDKNLQRVFLSLADFVVTRNK